MTYSLNEETLRKIATSLGIADLGVSAATPLSGYADFIKKRPQEEKGVYDVDFHETDKAYIPSMYLEGVKSIIVLFYPYDLTFEKSVKAFESLETDPLTVSEAAIFEDYHKGVIRQCQTLIDYLEETYGAKSIAYSDTGPLNDKSLMLRTKKVTLCRNSLLAHPKFGTRFYIGYILTDLFIENEASDIVDSIDLMALYTPQCKSCGRCQKACPNGAIQNFGYLTSKRCISYLTQSKDWDKNPGQDLTLNGSVYGCDICQKVCPLNIKPLTDYHRQPLVDKVVDVDKCLTYTNRQFKAVYGGTSAGWIGNRKFKRNINYHMEEED